MVLVEFSVFPLGKGESVGDYVARCLKIVEQSGLEYQCHAMGTTIEGELDEVLDVVKRCLKEVSTDCNRVECIMKLDYRKGYTGELKSRLARVEKRLGRAVNR
ncbi:MAG: MTH1187 family thiamine-binding protein [Thermoguttaceae bacterium]|jgi:uncharacterized protein (TIGR00106 family)